MAFEQIKARAAAYHDDLIAFAQDLIRIPSLSGAEGPLAQRILAELQKLRYDECGIDGIGNVVGILRGGDGPAVLYASHLDHVSPGDETQWEFPPYGAVIAGEFLHGRGASDIKGAIACQVYAGAVARDLGLLGGHYIVGGIVQQESGGSVGIQHLIDVTLPEDTLKADLVILGDPTNLDICLGHRGRIELNVTTVGRTAHASAPWLGINAVYKMVPLVEAFEKLAKTLPAHALLEKSTLTVTNVESSPRRPSVIPDRCRMTVDRRFLPSEPAEEVIGQIQAILNRLQTSDPTFKATVTIAVRQVTSYTGLTTDAAQSNPAFLTDEDHPYVQKVASALQESQGYAVFSKWYNGTAGSYTSGVRHIPTLGYAPGEEKYTHSPFDRVRISSLDAALAGYAALHLSVTGVTGPTQG
ncbi:MAG: YgeY family selenium metabolism-linked hydrolase [Candidatus Sericytochromatia bacterium]|nr:YgeY family selenium metabolism-linked hydrolase [Candidatus Sericytochromatia bacterium]